MSLTPDSNSPERFHMTLLKQDVAERAREILRYGTVSGLHNDSQGRENNIESMLAPSSIITPEQDRIRLRKQSPRSKAAEEQFFRVFRGEDY